MRIGFTGTQRGMTIRQRTELAILLRNVSGEFHHGDCIGADAEAHEIARRSSFTLIGHPPDLSTKRAYTVCDEWRILENADA